VGNGGDGVLLSFREKRKKNQERKAAMPADSIRRGWGLNVGSPERWRGVGTVYFLFSGEKRKVPKKKAESVKLRLPEAFWEKRLGHRVPAFIEPAPSLGA